MIYVSLAFIKNNYTRIHNNNFNNVGRNLYYNNTFVTFTFNLHANNRLQMGLKNLLQFV